LYTFVTVTPGIQLFFQNFKLFTRLALEFPWRKHTLPEWHVLPPCYVERHHPMFDVLENGDGLAVSHSLQDLPIDGKNFIA